jgi:hypothetical protein
MRLLHFKDVIAGLDPAIHLSKELFLMDTRVEARV